MSLRSIGLALTLLLCSVAGATAQDNPVRIHNGFVAGIDYREYGDFQKRAYVTGVVDGMFLAPVLEAPKPQIEWLEDCVTGMTDVQVVGIVDRWLTTHPERWDQSMHILLYSAIVEACEVRGFARPDAR